jgi:guanylate kinase
MIILIGASASGKSTIEKELVEIGYKNIISYTSRPIRENEKNHRDYHFISEKEFISFKMLNFFAESTIYNSWHYGIALEDLKPESIAVVEPYGFRQLLKKSKINNFDIISFFIDAPERIRLIRMINRGDNLMEAFRRIFSDQGVFQGVQEETTYIVNNDRPLQETIDEIDSKLKFLRRK